MDAPRDPVDALLEQVLEQPAEAREAFLADATSDTALRRRVQARLDAYASLSREMHALLDAPASPPRPPRADDPHGLSGQTIGHYAVGRVLGGGGMGVVYRAEDTRLHRTVALKFLPPVLSTDAQAKQRFAAEAQAASALDHPHICTIYEIGQVEGGQLFIAMAHYEGQTLKDRLARGTLPVDEALGYARQMADALACAHNAGIIHRDVKPANVMITPEGRVKLLDFGLAKIADLQLTQMGTTMGTAPYMSPEQTRGEAVDGRTDLWSLGIVLYEMLSGTRPFDGAYEQATVYNILNQLPEDLTARAPEVPPTLAAIVMRCLEKDPSDRYPDADTLVAELDALRQGSSPRPLLPAPLAAAPRRMRAAVLGAGLAGVLLLMALYFRPGSAGSSPTDAGVLRVAVLPFDEVGVTDETRAFVDGMVYTISSTLVEMEKLAGRITVVPASDVIDAGLTSAAEAATSFDARFVFTGSVIPGGNRVRFALYLYDANENSVTRSILLDQQRADPLALQDSVAIHLATLLGVELDAEARHMLASGSTASADAFEAYTQGRGYLLRYETAANVERAITLFERAIAADSLYALAHAALGEAYWRRYEHTDAPQWVEAAATSGKRAVQLAPTLSAVRVTLGIIYKGTGRYAEAERELRLALDIDPDNAFAHQQLAATYYYLGQREAAEASYKEAIRLKPDYWAFYNNLGFLYNAEGRHAEAVDVYRRVIELRPDNPWGYNNLGVQYEHMGDLARAERLYEQAATVNPSSVEPTAQARRNLATLAYRRRDFAKAVEGYRTVLQADSTRTQVWSDLAYAAHWLGDGATERRALARAIAQDARALRVNPQDADRLARLAMNTALNGEAGRARQTLARLETIDAVSADLTLLLTIATTHLILGDEERALDVLAQARSVGATRQKLATSMWLEALLDDARYTRLFPAGE